jgi:hypothetical protein
MMSRDRRAITRQPSTSGKTSRPLLPASEPSACAQLGGRYLRGLMAIVAKPPPSW